MQKNTTTKLMNDQQKTDALFKIWLNSGMTKTEFAKLCGWKNSSNLCRMLSGNVKTSYEHLEIACKAMGINFKVEIECTTMK